MAKLIVVKVGTSVVTDGARLKSKNLAEVSRQIATLRVKGSVEPLIVTSGAIGLGMKELGLKKRPARIPLQQAAAAVGQARLIQVWNSWLKKRGSHASQILLSQEDFRSEHKLLNLRHCIDASLKMNAIPVINENDATATKELKHGHTFSDNDMLSSLIAVHLAAEMLVILTDSRPGPGLGTGGAHTKVQAALHASNNGVRTVIVPFFKNSIVDAVTRRDIGTVYNPRSPKTNILKLF